MKERGQMGGDDGPEMGSNGDVVGRPFTVGKEKEREGFGEGNGSEG